MGRRRGLPAEADPPGRGRRRDPEVSIREDPASRAQGPRSGLALARAPAAPCRPVAASLELAALRLVRAHPAQAEQLADEDLLRAEAVPVMMLGATQAAHVLD